MSDADFFAKLPPLNRFLEVPDPQYYRPAPDSWNLVITDVQGSTKAIEAGRYKDVNALGVASIVAVRNAAPDVELPFVFGGDGATMLCPEPSLEAIRPALRGLQRTARDAFELGLRAGVVPVGELRQAGHEVLVARFAASPQATFAMFAGSGLSVGEKWVKDPERGRQYAVDEDGDEAVDFTGFECRWQPLPARHGLIVSLLVQATSDDRSQAAQIYQSVLQRIEAIVDGDDTRPVAEQTLELATDSSAFDQESRLKTGTPHGLRFALARLKMGSINRIGRLLLARKWNALGFPGKTYRGEVVANSDYRKFDDTLRMVLDLSADQLTAIEAHLLDEHQAGRLVFGVHRTDAALMTCVITDHQGEHVHFVDGANGGYALAAKQLKAQLQELNA